MATTGTSLARAVFAKPLGGWINLKLLDPTGVTVGDTLTVTRPATGASPPGGTLSGTVFKLLPLGIAQIHVTACSRPSGALILPKGSAVA